MRKTLLVLLFVLTAILLSYVFAPNITKNINRFLYSDLPVDTTDASLKNRAILKYADAYGAKISPTYQEAVCTEYLIQIIDHFNPLNKDQKNKIRIITQENIDTLLNQNDLIPAGVYYSLSSTDIGIPIDDIREVKAGDFVQFWDKFNGRRYGHCGIVRAVDIEKGIMSLYSSSPRTNGHGKQIYVIPEYVYFVRLK
jgi:hypothetical protein